MDRGIPAERHQPDPGIYDGGRGATHLGARQPRHDPGGHPLRSTITGIRFSRDGIDTESFAGIGMVPPGDTDVALGRKRARAAVLLELALPGGAYVYQGDELGLEEVEDLPEDVLQDPVWKRTHHTVRGGTATGCRYRGRVRSRRSDSGRSSIHPGYRSLRTGQT